MKKDEIKRKVPTFVNPRNLRIRHVKSTCQVWCLFHQPPVPESCVKKTYQKNLISPNDLISKIWNSPLKKQENETCLGDDQRKGKV